MGLGEKNKKRGGKGKNNAKQRRNTPNIFLLVGAKLIFWGNNMIHLHNIYACSTVISKSWSVYVKKSFQNADGKDSKFKMLNNFLIQILAFRSEKRGGLVVNFWILKNNQGCYLGNYISRKI